MAVFGFDVPLMRRVVQNAFCRLFGVSEAAHAVLKPMLNRFTDTIHDHASLAAALSALTIGDVRHILLSSPLPAAEIGQFVACCEHLISHTTNVPQLLQWVAANLQVCARLTLNLPKLNDWCAYWMALDVFPVVHFMRALVMPANYMSFSHAERFFYLLDPFFEEFTNEEQTPISEINRRILRHFPQIQIEDEAPPKTDFLVYMWVCLLIPSVVPTTPPRWVDQ